MKLLNNDKALRELALTIGARVQILFSDESARNVAEDSDQSLMFGDDFNLNTDVSDLKDSMEFIDNYDREVYYHGINKIWTENWSECQFAFDELGYDRSESIMGDIQIAVNAYLNNEARNEWSRNLELFCDELTEAQDDINGLIEQFMEDEGLSDGRFDHSDILPFVMALMLSGEVLTEEEKKRVPLDALQSFLTVSDAELERAVLSMTVPQASVAKTPSRSI